MTNFFLERRCYDVIYLHEKNIGFLVLKDDDENIKLVQFTIKVFGEFESPDDIYKNLYSNYNYTIQTVDCPKNINGQYIVKTSVQGKKNFDKMQGGRSCTHLQRSQVFNSGINAGGYGNKPRPIKTLTMYSDIAQNQASNIGLHQPHLSPQRTKNNFSSVTKSATANGGRGDIKVGENLRVSSSRNLFNLTATSISLKEVNGIKRILKTDNECTNLYIQNSSNTILILFGIQNTNFFTKLEIVFDFFEHEIQNFFPIGFGEHILVVFSGGEIALVDVKSTRSYEIRELDLLRNFSKPKKLNFDKYGKIIEDTRQGIHSLFQENSFVTASNFQPLQLQTAKPGDQLLSKYGYLMISEGYKDYTIDGSERIIQSNLYFIKVVYTKPDYTLIKKGEGLHIIHTINYEKQGLTKDQDYFDAFKNIEINFVHKKQDQMIIINVSCIQGRGEKMLIVYEYQDKSLMYQVQTKKKLLEGIISVLNKKKKKLPLKKAKKKEPSQDVMKCLVMLKMPYSLSNSTINRTINFRNAIWTVTASGEVIRICFDRGVYDACADPDGDTEKSKCNLI